MAYLMTRPVYKKDDVVYIIDTDEIGIVDEVLNIGNDVVFVAIETQDSFLIVSSNDLFVTKL